MAKQAVVVVAADEQPLPVLDQAPHQSQATGRVGSAIDQIP